MLKELNLIQVTAKQDISNTDEALLVETRHTTSVLSLLHLLNIEITMSLMSGATNN